MGLMDEDHASAIVFNVMGFMVTQLGIKTGRFPKEFDDMQNMEDMHEEYLKLKERNMSEEKDASGTKSKKSKKSKNV